MENNSNMFIVLKYDNHKEEELNYLQYTTI